MTPSGQSFRILTTANRGHKVDVASAWHTLQESLRLLPSQETAVLFQPFLHQICWSCWTCWIAFAPEFVTWFSFFLLPRHNHQSSTATPQVNNGHVPSRRSSGSTTCIRKHQVRQANLRLEVAFQTPQQSMICKGCNLCLMFPDDCGGHAITGPTSIWACKEFRSLESVRGARRGAACLCQLADVDVGIPTSILTDIPSMWTDHRVGRPCSSLDSAETPPVFLHTRM